MMNKLMKKLAVAFTAATMTITATGIIAHANDGMGIYAEDHYTDNDIEYVYDDVNDDIEYVYDDIDDDIEYVYDDINDDIEYTDGNDNMNTYYTVTVRVSFGYLALRNSPYWTDDDSNVIEELYSGQKFTVTENHGQYLYGYSNSTGRCGYVNADYVF